MARRLGSCGLLILLGVLVGMPLVVPGGEPSRPLLRRYSGRVPILGLNPAGYPNPVTLTPENEDCTNRMDDDADTFTDFADPDCLAELGPQDINLKLPFDVIQPIAGFLPARYTGTERNGDGQPEILINSTALDGRKLSYLRTDDPNTYTDVTIRALIRVGGAGDQGGPVAVRIQAADAKTNAGRSYFVKVVPGTSVSIHKDLGDGTTAELASASQWASGEAIDIAAFDETPGPCYEVVFTAADQSLQATITESTTCGVNNNDELNTARTVTLSATDGDLLEGYVGLRADADNSLGGPADDVFSRGVDPSILDFIIIDPETDDISGAPRIAFFNSFKKNLDDRLDYTTTPISHTDLNPYNRSGTTVADAGLATYLRSLGFQVDEYIMESFSLGLLAPEEINSAYDLFWVPASGASADTRGFARSITIPFVYAEHVDGTSEWAGLYTRRNSGNETNVACGDGRTLSPTSIRVLSAEMGGDPNHPIIRGLADENGDIVVHDTARIELNNIYVHPGNGLGLTGAGFKTIKQILDERGWGSGAPQTQFGGYPLTPGAFALGAMINPCTGQPFLQVDEKGNQTNTDMCGSAPCGHVAVIAAEAGTPRTLDCPMPPDCPTGQFDNRVVFYWLSDPNFPYATPATLTILRRAPLWALGYLDSPNRSDVPFKRGDFDDNGEVNITDAVSTFNFLFLGGGPPHCMDAADANDTEDVDISDGVFSLNFLFLGGRRIPSPFVNAYQGCALDFTPAPSEAEVKNPDSILPCASYDSCAN